VCRFAEGARHPRSGAAPALNRQERLLVARTVHARTVQNVLMIRGYTAQQIRAAEAPHLAAREPLMQRAADGLARHIQDLLGSRKANRAARVLLLVGSGDNGGDTLFAGAKLAQAGADTTALLVGSRAHEAGWQAAEEAGVSFAAPGRPAEIRRLAASVDLIVDGIVGTGTSANPALRGVARDVVEAILAVVTGPNGPVVVAVDIPSGINPDDGSVPDPAVLPATVTVTFGGIKAGLLIGRGAELAGEVRLVEIGIEGELASVTPAVEIR
jgi:hydroxyethylthiazole kinase-like uncharacterized protein yjeF